MAKLLKNIITNMDSNLTDKAEDFRAKMPEQINSSVMWYQSVQCAMDKGVDTFIEFGSGKVLAGLNRKISSEIVTYNIFDTNSLNNTLQAIKNEYINV